MSPEAPAPELWQGRLADLQTELVDLAVSLERQHRLDAADVAVMVAHRLGELFAEAGQSPQSGSVPGK